MNRRGFLTACIASAMAPAIVRASSLMPVRAVSRVWYGPFPPAVWQDFNPTMNMSATEVLFRREEYLAQQARAFDSGLNVYLDNVLQIVGRDYEITPQGAIALPAPPAGSHYDIVTPYIPAPKRIKRITL